MNNDEAKFILQAYRPGGQDAQDPEFSEALGQTRRDPELAAWFEAQRTTDAAIAAKLKQLPVPSNLKGAILAGSRITRTASIWNRRQLLALAASLVFLGTLALLWNRAWSPANFASFREDMLEMTTSGSYRLGLRTAEIRQVKEWLATNRGHEDFVVPQGAEGAPTFGCQVLDWRGRAVSMICFRVQGEVIHLFVINRSDLKGGAPEDEAPKVVSGKSGSAVTWTRGEKAYLLTGVENPDILRTFL